MDNHGIQFQFDYNRLEFVLSQSDIEKILQIENRNMKRNGPISPTSASHQFKFTNANSDGGGFVRPFFHPPEQEELQLLPSSPDDVIKEHQEQKELSPLSPLDSLSEIIIKPSMEEYPANFDTTTAAVFASTNATTTMNIIDFNQEMLLTTSSSMNSTRDWASEEIGAIFIVCLMIPFIICSNLLVIFSVIRFRRLHTPTNYFITSLAIVDIIVGLVTPLVIAVQMFQYGGDETMNSAAIVCLLPNRILMMSCGVSLLNLATIAYDRHTALICPLEYVYIMTSRKVAIFMTSSWIYSGFIVWLPLALGWYDSSFPSSQCSVDHLHHKAHILFVAAIFVPSCTVILICYSRIFLVARHHAKSIAAVEFAVHRRLQVRFMIKDTKYAKTLALVIGGFLALWLPYLIYTFMKAVCGISLNVWLETYLILLAVFNSGINPWIYAFKNNEFQAAFKRMAREYCANIVCRGDGRRGSLISGMSITPRLSRTDSRIAPSILEATTDYGLSEKKIHKNLGYTQSMESESSDYNGNSCRDIISDNKTDSKSNNYICHDMPATCTLLDENEHKEITSSSECCSSKGCILDKCKTNYSHTGDYKQIHCKDESHSHSILKTAVFNVRQASKEHLNHLKRIKNKSSDIIRSASAMSAIKRPAFIPIERRPSSSLPSSPIIHPHNIIVQSQNKPLTQSHNCSIQRFHSICVVRPPSFPIPSSHIYPQITSHFLQAQTDSPIPLF